MVAVKLCGIRTPEGAEAAGASGASHAGLLFVPGRKRAIDLATAKALLPLLGGATPVSVFLDASREAILETVSALGTDWVQLHGDEPPELTEALAQEGLQVIRALSPAQAADTEAVARHAEHAKLFLLDGASPGSGARVPEAELRALVARLPLPVWIAGGLDPSNVAAALAATGADGADVASGIEEGGHPSPARMKAFVEEARKHTT